jgi:glucose/mannose-6-phosphate isomerase
MSVAERANSGHANSNGTNSGGGDLVDSTNLHGQLLELADRLERAAAVYSAPIFDLPDRTVVEHVVLLAAGADAVAAAAVVAAASAECSVPLIVSSSYELPGFVGEASLVVVCAADLEADEVVEAAMSARAAGANVVVIGGGERTAELTAEVTMVVPVGVPVGRLRVVETIAALVSLLAELELYVTGRGDLDAAVTQLRERERKLGDARKLARRMGSHWPVIHGVGPIGAAAAMWWKQAINTMAKAPAFSSGLPEAARDEVVGWGQHGDISRQVLTMITLRHDGEHPQLSELVAQLEPWQLEVVGGTVEVRAEGEGPLAQWFDLMMQGTALALELAAVAGIDPGPAPVLDSLL